MNRHRKMKGITIAAMFVFVIAPITLFAQSASELGLVLDGKDEKCATAEIGDPELACHKLRMVIRNEGKEPVIIINPTLGYGTGLKEVTFYFKYSDFDFRTFHFFQNTGESKVVFAADVNKTENFRAMAQLFDGERPPENMTIILQPHETFVFVDKFEVKPQYKYTAAGTIPVVEANGKKSKFILESERVSPHNFRLTYEFSFLPYADDPDLLDKMSQRWRRSGRLPVGINGTYTITSEPLK